MKHLFKRLTSTQEKKVLLENFFSLSFLQIANYVLPLITFPYLVRVLGPDRFGLVAFAQAFNQYYAILTDYGFNLSATREISINREDTKKVARIFNAVMVIKIGLTVLCFLSLIPVTMFIPKFREDPMIYFLTFGFVIGTALFPTWFYQGIERMKYISLLNILGKMFFTVLIFVFVRTQDDYLYVPLLTSIGFVITGVTGLWLAYKQFHVVFMIPSYQDVICQLREGWHIFVSMFAISLYTTSNTVILGFFANNTIVGYFSAAYRIIQFIQRLIQPISQAIYPYISRLVNRSREKALDLIQKLIIILFGLGFTISGLILILADRIVPLVLGEQFLQSIGILRILSFIPLILMMSNVVGIQTILAFDYKKMFYEIIIKASIINLLIMIVFAYYYQGEGVAVVSLIAEAFVLFLMVQGLNKKGVYVLQGLGKQLLNSYQNKYSL